MFQDIIDELRSSSQSTHYFNESIKRLCKLGNEWETIEEFASYYVVQSLIANSVSLMLGDIRFRTSYSSLVTLNLDEKGKFSLSTVNFDNFPDESYEINEIISDEVLKRCLNSSYSKNVMRNILAAFGNEEAVCKAQIRTGIFWSDILMSVSDCQKIFKSLGRSDYFTFGDDPFSSGAGGPDRHLSYRFMKQTNRFSLNGIQFKVKIKRNTIFFEVLDEGGVTKIFREIVDEDLQRRG